MTNKELAQKLNVSPAALSLALNNKPGISDATRKRILEQLEALGYGDLARKKAPRSENLCFVVFKKHGGILDQHPFFLLLMEGLEAQTRRYGMNLLFFTVDCRQPLEAQVERLNALDAKGIVVFATEMLQEDISFFRSLNLPFVALDNDFTRSDVDTVAINNEMGIFQAVEHLVSLGHREIGCLRSSRRISSFDERQRAFRNALASFSLPLREEQIVTLGYTEQESCLDFKAYLAGKPSLPTAFVSEDDTMSIGAMRALQEAGFRVPEDVSLVGFNNRPNCKTVQPGLTTIDVPKQSFGIAAIDALVQLIQRRDRQEPPFRGLKTRISTQILLLGSTAPPRAIPGNHEKKGSEAGDCGTRRRTQAG